MKSITLVGIFCAIASLSNACDHSDTTVSGPQAPGQVCSGQLIFEDNFDWMDHSKWKPENTLAGGRNWEFQWYSPSPANHFTDNGNLHLKPTLTSELMGDDFITSEHVLIADGECTQSEFFGCERQGSLDAPINPIRSTKLTTWDSFAFKYGTLEIRAKMSAGDWLWPALWMLPRYNVYGEWPKSGEIDLTEVRGNRKLFNDGVNVGVEQAGSTLHFGPEWDVNGWSTAHFTKNKDPGYAADFHVYKVHWTPWFIQFFIDDEIIGTVDAGNGFWARGGFEDSGKDNPWGEASNMAPFDQEFYIIMNLAVGGTNYFADAFHNEGYDKPWSNGSPRAAAEFWAARDKWESTWNRDSTDSHMQVDYVRVYAL